MLVKELIKILEERVDGDYPVLIRDKHGERYSVGAVEVYIAPAGTLTLKIGTFMEEED